MIFSWATTNNFLIKADTADLAGSISFTGSEDNSLFLDYKNFLQEKRGELNQTQSQISSSATAADSAMAQERIKEINHEMEDYMDDIEKEHSQALRHHLHRSHQGTHSSGKLTQWK